MTTWLYEFEVDVDDEVLKNDGITEDEYQLLEAMRSCHFVKDAIFISGITKEKNEELKNLYGNT